MVDVLIANRPEASEESEISLRVAPIWSPPRGEPAAPRQAAGPIRRSALRC